MCGRYTIRRSLRDLLDDIALAVGPIDLPPRYNIAPSQDCPIIRLDHDGGRVVSMARWGLIPSWTKGKPKTQPINAKSETAATSRMFRQAMERRRCLVLADGFYEWQGAKPPKQPYFIHLKDDSPFAFAGLWERWKPDETAEPIDTFTILTTQPNEMMQSIHGRMPVMLKPQDQGRWLEGGEDAGKLLAPYPAHEMEAYPVSRQVNSPRNDGAELTEAVAPGRTTLLG